MISIITQERINQSIIILLLILCYNTSFSQLSKYNYKSQYEPDSKVILKDYNTTIEKLKTGKYILKNYYPENKMITLFATFKSKKLKVKDGLSFNQSDYGDTITRGNYIDNKKEGNWVEHNWRGEYQNNLREGKWALHEKSKVLQEQNFKEGKLSGNQYTFDTLGNVVIESSYLDGQLVSENLDSTLWKPYEPARFAECKSSKTSEEKISCSNTKMHTFIYSKLKYPKKARSQDIDGMVIVELTISEEGSVSEISFIRALSIDIKKECTRVLEKMNKWIPAKQGGIPVQSKVKIPIVFTLD